jgi:peroxiredoxin
MQVTIIGVSTEPVETLCSFADEAKIPYILLSDFDRQASKAYGTLVDEIAGLTMVTRPSMFVINKEGKITFKWIHDEQTPLPDSDLIIDHISRTENGPSN